MVNYMRTKSAIMDVKAPKEMCENDKCPFHGTLKVRGKAFTGLVVSDNMQRSVLVQWTGSRYVPKYERYEKTRTKVCAHNPSCVDARTGDIVRTAECRPLSKTKTFVVLGIVGKKSVKEQVKDEGVAESKKVIESSNREVQKEETETKLEDLPEDVDGSLSGKD